MVVIKTVLSLIVNLIEGSTEFVKDFVVSLALVVLFGIMVVGYYFLGQSLFINLISVLFIMFLGIHIVIGLTNVIKDYIYNKSVVYFLQGMLGLLLIRIVLEVIVLNIMIF